MLGSSREEEQVHTAGVIHTFQSNPDNHNNNTNNIQNNWSNINKLKPEILSKYKTNSNTLISKLCYDNEKKKGYSRHRFYCYNFLTYILAINKLYVLGSQRH